MKPLPQKVFYAWYYKPDQEFITNKIGNIGVGGGWQGRRWEKGRNKENLREEDTRDRGRTKMRTRRDIS